MTAQKGYVPVDEIAEAVAAWVTGVIAGERGVKPRPAKLRRGGPRSYVYSVVVRNYPAGYEADPVNWAPPGWDEELDALVAQGRIRPRELGDRRFFWPVSDKLYKSRSAAKERRDLLRYYGADAVLVRSELVWERVGDDAASTKEAAS